ncbi:MAG: capsular biosynthesis protein [Bacteroidia bacterium]|nr:capsular biosynthesis protein [Bacteroidia bacterium]
MAGFFKKLFSSSPREEANLSLAPLHTDIHSHLIPGIDDGAKTMEDSLNMVRVLGEIGYKKLITTPHIMSDFYKNTPEIIRSGLEKLKQACQEAGLEMEFDCAAEYYLDEGFEERLSRKEEFLTFGGSEKYLLFETSYTDRPMSLESRIFEMNTLGYKPVMAHPERYNFHWGKKLDTFEKLKDAGVLFQVNISSFSGHYTERAQRSALMLLDAGFIDFLGTDMHRARQMEPLKKALAGQEKLRELVYSGKLLNPTL